MARAYAARTLSTAESNIKLNIVRAGGAFGRRRQSDFVAEAVTNAVRHARASLVRVVLTTDGSSLAIEVTDDGCGVPAEPVPGLGLSSMRLRAEELGGALRISTGEAGTSVLARIPMASPSSAGAGSVPRVPVHLS